MEVEIVSTQTIRPAPAATPDDHHLKKKCFTLSIFDQLSPAMYVPLILFYTSADGFSVEEASERLKKSLSETLTRFFPLAGRIRDNTYVDCSSDKEDRDIEYTEARVRGISCKDILGPPNMEALGQLLPVVNCSFSTEEAADRLLLVRLSVFECGGIAIGICFSHKLGDAATIISFLKSWSATAGGSSISSVVAPPPPDLISLASRFPPSDTFATFVPVPSFGINPEIQKFTSRRFVFSGSKVASLKAKSCCKAVPHPTSVEAVNSLIWQCAMRSKPPPLPPFSSSSSSSGLGQVVNLRNRINPPLPDSSFGNLVGFYAARAPEEENKKDLPSLVAKLRSAKEEYMQNYPKRLGGRPDTIFSVITEGFKQAAELASKENINGDGLFTMYWFSSLCKLDLYGAADFGWGKPIWATFYDMNIKNFGVLSDTRDGKGIQVWLSLPEDQMVVFEKDPLLLSFASPNPSVAFDKSSLPPATGRLCFTSSSASSSLFHCPSIAARLNFSPSQRPVCLRLPQPPTLVHSRSILFISSVL